MKYLSTTIIVILVIILAVLYNNSYSRQQFVGSVIDGQAYTGTSTFPGGWTNPVLLKRNGGVFGAVTVISTTTGSLMFYDATTTNVSLRDATQSTSSIIITGISGGQTVGDYVFEHSLMRGLIVQAIGTAPTTTITYK